MKNYTLLILFIISILITSCSTNYLGVYTYRKNSKYYHSEIEITKNNLLYSASEHMLGNIVQKSNYTKKGRNIYVDFIIKDTTKSYINSYLDKQSNDVKISIKAIVEKDTFNQYVKVIINDSLNYVHDKDTIFKKMQIKKIEIKDNGLEFINDTILYFPEKNEDNVYKLFIRTRNGTPILAQLGKRKFRINGNKLTQFNYDTLHKKYIKTKIYIRKTKISFKHEYDFRN